MEFNIVSFDSAAQFDVINSAFPWRRNEQERALLLRVLHGLF